MEESIPQFSEKYFNYINSALKSLDLGKIEEIAKVLFGAYKNEKQVFVLGNGGSASTASHFACDLSKSTIRDVRDSNEKRMKVISLTDNIATIMAFGNDLSFADVFVQQLRNLVNPGDVVVGITGSGNSPNVIKAIECAKERKAKTIGLLGFKTGGKARELVDYEITVQDNHYGRIEDIHLMLAHLITDIVRELKKEE